MAPSSQIFCGTYNLVKYGELPIKVKTTKDYLKVDSKKDDDLILSLLHEVVLYAEGMTGRAMRTNQWELVVDAFDSPFQIRKSPVSAITSIKYFDDADTPVEQTVAAATYYLKVGHQFTEILLANNKNWPVDLIPQVAGITIAFTTGVAREVERMKTGLLKHIAHLYQNRGDCDVTDAAVKSGAANLYRQAGLSIVRV